MEDRLTEIRERWAGVQPESGDTWMPDGKSYWFRAKEDVPFLLAKLDEAQAPPRARIEVAPAPAAKK